MSTKINTSYNQFYKGTEQIKNFGSASGKKNAVVHYQFNTTDDEGNKIMDKMSKEETMKALNTITSQYGDNVIVEFSGDGLTAFEEHKGKIPLPNEPVREVPEGMITPLEGPEILTEEELAARRKEEEDSHSRSGKEILSKMQEVDPMAYKEYQTLSEKTKNEGFDPYNNEVIFMARWQMKRDFPQLNAWKKEGLDNKDSVIKNDHIMTDYKYEFASRMPAVYGEQDQNGDYIRNFYSVADAANHMLKVYATLYDEIVKGYEAGTRETYVEDKTAEAGYRKLTMEEELQELDKAYEDYVDRYASDRDKHIIDILSAYEKKVSEISDGRASIADEVGDLLEKYKNDPVPENFSRIMRRAAESFIKQYREIDMNNIDWDNIIKESFKENQSEM